MGRLEDRFCLISTIINGITVVCDRRPRHDGLHRDSDIDMTWWQTTSPEDEED